jgi:hypothetical protein
MADDPKTGRVDSPRLIAAIAAIIGGVVAIVKGALGGFGPGTEQLFVWIGIGLVVLGVAGIFVYRWMAKRNL